VLALGLAVLVLGRVLAEVPEPAPLVLGVPVVGVLDELGVLGHPVVDDGGGDAEDRLRPVGDRDLDALAGTVGSDLTVDPVRAGRHRPKPTVRRPDETLVRD